MNSLAKRRKHARVPLVSLLVVAAQLALPASAQERVHIEIGEPNLWSLEQAHYLLARMRATDQDLKNRAPSDTDLDPNATQATRLELIRSFFGADPRQASITCRY